MVRGQVRPKYVVGNPLPPNVRGKPRHYIEAEQYAALVQAFRSQPGNMAHASREAKCSTTIAKRAYFRGWEKVGLRPIMAMVVEEQAAGRRVAMAWAEQEQRRMRGGLTEAGEISVEEERRLSAAQRAKEGRLAQIAATNALGLMSIISKMIPGALALAERVGAELKAHAPMKPREFLAMARALGQLTNWANDSGERALQIERIRLGLPSAILGINVAGNVEDAVQAVHRAQSVMERAKELGLVLPGGRAATGAPVPLGPALPKSTN